MKNFAIKSIVSFFTFLFVAAGATLAQQNPQIPGAENPPPQAQTNVVKVCLALPKVQLAEGGNVAETAAALRGVVAQHLKSPSIEAVEMESQTPSTVLAEAKEKGCKFVLQTALTQKKANGFANVFGSLATMLGNAVPGAGKSGGTTIADQIASTAIQKAANLFSKVKSKDQITLEYSLASANDNAKVAGQTLTAKAKSDGEDVVSPMIEKTAEAVRQAAK